MALNSRITLQQPAAGEDALGQAAQGWVDVASLWADIRHPSGVQAIQADAQVSTVRASIRVNLRADIVAGMRVVHGATAYAIHAVLPDERRRQYMDLVCEVVA